MDVANIFLNDFQPFWCNVQRGQLHVVVLVAYVQGSSWRRGGSGEGVGVAVAAVDDRPRTSPNVCTAPFSLQAVHNALPTKARRHLSKL